MLFVFNKRILIGLIALLPLYSLMAQNDSLHRALIKKEQERKDDWLSRDRFYWGGNLGLNIGNPTFVDVSPLLFYKVNKKLWIGAGGIYNYYRYTYLGYKYELNLYGTRLNVRYFVFENVFLQAGWDHINRDDPYSRIPGTRVWIDNLLVGGGFRSRITDNISIIASGMWNLNQGPLSPYRNPILQIGFVAGF